MNARILVIEDERAIARAVALRLETAGFVAECAGSAIEGLELAATGRFSAVLLDLRLPDLDGLEVLARLGADPRTRALPVVVLSASLSDRTRDAALVLGASAALAKPFGSRELLRAVEAALASSALRAGGAA